MSESRALLFLSQAEVSRLLDLDRLFDALAGAFVELSAGRASVPPRIAARTASGGLLGAMPGYVSGVLEAKLVSVFPQNHVRGMPSHQGLIVLFDENTGAPIAVMDGVAITAIRTGASAAVAARWLARQDSATLAILGAGVQGRSNLEAFSRSFFFQAEDGIRDLTVTGVQTCALPISRHVGEAVTRRVVHQRAQLRHPGGGPPLRAGVRQRDRVHPRRAPGGQGGAHPAQDRKSVV